MNTARILIIEDDPEGRQSVTEAIEDLGFDVVSVETGLEGEKCFREEPFDVVLSDLVLPDIDGVEVLGRIRKMNAAVPFLIMTAYGTVSTAVNALKAGAYDYITKPLDLDDLQIKISRAAETRKLRTEIADLHQAIKERYSSDSMVFVSSKMHELIAQVKTLAMTDATVHIEGESGVGKELVARALHVDGNRKNGPFIGVNCGAFTENLLESELFGHEKGAFTGATGLRKGAFERADGGTLFLDEIGNAPVSVQVKLLRVLEEREFMRVGGQNIIHVDVRVISASNRELGEMVEAGEFREDLLYRLKVVTLVVPPLRDRKDDVRGLADHFIALSCKEHGRSIERVEPDVYERLMKHDWPGNVRELRNVIESSVIMAPGSVLKESELRINDVIRQDAGGFAVPDGMNMADMEKEILIQMLDRNQGNKTIVADKLGISRRTIQRKIKDYGLPF